MIRTETVNPERTREEVKKGLAFLERRAAHIFAFLIPFAILLTVYARFGVAPFGEKSVLIADMNSQYADFFNSLRDVLTGQSPGGFFYSWSAGPGLNYAGILAYYLASPFSFIVLLFPKGNITEALFLMILLKVASSGVTFSVLAEKKFGLSPALRVVFSCLYALSSYSVVYTTSPMWLDAVILLPLLILGLDRLIAGKSVLPFAVTLALTFVTNFYISYMVGIFSFFYLIAEYAGTKRAGSRFVPVFIRFMLTAAVSLCAAGIVLLPAFYSIFDSYRTISYFSLGLTKSFGAADLFSKLFMGSYESLTYGTPNIYCGVPTVFLTLLYFLNTRISRRRKLCSAAVLLAFVFSFVFDEPNLAWHMFRVPTWFPFRYSFLFIFYCLSLACECVRERAGIKLPAVGVSAALLAAVLFWLDRVKFAYLTRAEIFINLAFLLIWAVLTALYAADLKAVPTAAAAKALAVVFVSGELFFSTASNIAGLDQQFGYKDRAYFADYYARYSRIVSDIRDDSPFYRTAIDTVRDSNDAMSLNIKGLAHYSSVSNQCANLFLGSLGYYNGFADRYFFYYGATSAADSLFGVKYLISPGRRDFGLRALKNYDGETLFENENALPLGYAVSRNLLGLPAENGDPFDRQNRFLQYALGNGTAYYHKIEGISGSHIPDGYGGGHMGTGAAYVSFSVVNDRPQYVYFYSKNNFSEGAALYLNGEQISEFPAYRVKGIVSLGWFEAGETVTLGISTWNGTSSFESAMFYGADEEAFRAAADTLRAGGLVLDREPGTVISGTAAAKDGDSLLFLSVPYDKGWRAWIDGGKTEILKVGDGFMALDLPEGKHSVRLRFVPRGFVPGAALSVLGIGAMCLYGFWRRKSQRKQTLSGPREV